MAIIRSFQLIFLFICSLDIIKSESYTSTLDFYEVKNTIVESAGSKGAVCLDGSLPVYNFDPGFGEGVSNWLVQISGGGWCSNVTDCIHRINNEHVGNPHISKTWNFTGMFSKNSTSNPDFYNWNKVFIRYCDGGSFTGDVEYVDPATNLHFRGARIFEAVLEDLLKIGLKNAKNAILAGTSASAYPTILYCDRFRSLLPNTRRVKCFADAGYFIHVKNSKQAKGFEDTYNALLSLHGSGKALPKSCTSKMEPLLCFFPQNMHQYTKTPLFIAMSAFDFYQLNTTVIPNCLKNCSASVNQTIKEFRAEFLNTLPKPNNPKLRGLFIDSFYHHTTFINWWGPGRVPLINNLSLPKAFADWYFDRKYHYVIDEQHDLPIIL